MTAKKEYFGEECPRCLTWAAERVKVCTNCGYPVPMALVLPYDDPPWEYSDDLVSTLRRYEALRLMAKYAGKAPGRLAELSHCRRLYLSRYKGFEFEFMKDFGALEYLELDYGPIASADGVQKIAPPILKFTECRQLESIDALAECKDVKFLSLALCNAIKDYSPVGAMTGLQSLFIEARALASLELLRGLPDLRSVTLGVDRLGSGDLEPLFSLDGLQEIAIRKKLVKAKDAARMRERWPEAEIVID